MYIGPISYASTMGWIPNRDIRIKLTLSRSVVAQIATPPETSSWVRFSFQALRHLVLWIAVWWKSLLFTALSRDTSTREFHHSTNNQYLSQHNILTDAIIDRRGHFIYTRKECGMIQIRLRKPSCPCWWSKYIGSAEYRADCLLVTSS